MASQKCPWSTLSALLILARSKMGISRGRLACSSYIVNEWRAFLTRAKPGEMARHAMREAMSVPSPADLERVFFLDFATAGACVRDAPDTSGS